jgi:hypothetical protein
LSEVSACSYSTTKPDSKKFSIYATKGTLRWISGNSPSSAYKIRTPLGTMGIRGTAFDVTIRNGRAYVALISGSAQFCTGATCRTLNKSCDYVEVSNGKVSEPKQVSNGFSSRQDASKIFPFLASSQRLSSRFHVGGENCLTRVANDTKTSRAPVRQQ